METKCIVGRNVQRLRETMKLSQSEFARKIGMDPSYLGRLERGEKNMRADTLLRIAEGLGVSVNALYKVNLEEMEVKDSLKQSILLLCLELDKLPERTCGGVFHILNAIVELLDVDGLPG